MAKRKPAMAEASVRAVIIGLGLSVVMGAANVYFGLKVGMTVSASIPATVIAMVILRGILRNGTILESNMVQTTASAGEALAAGVIFTMPALVIIGAWQKFDWFYTTMICFSGGLLGVLFMIPLRRVFITSPTTELKYPEGVACAAVLRAGEGDLKSQEGGAKVIMQGTLVGLAFKFLSTFAGMIKGMLEGATWLGGRVFYFGSEISPALAGVGFIVGLNVSLLLFAGGAIAWLIQLPLMSGAMDSTAPALDSAWGLWSKQIRYTGVGAMIVGGISSIYKVRHGILHAIAELRKSVSKQDAAKIDALDRDISANAIKGFSLLAAVIIGIIYYNLTGSAAIAAVTTLLMIVMAFFFVAVSSHIVGLVGNSNNPVSGITISAVLFTGGVLLLFGFAGMEGIVATIGVAAVICCAAGVSGDTCNDLKTGHMVGASPWKQQVLQIAGIAVAAVFMAPILQLLNDHTPGGIGGRELAAPQATLFASLAKSLFGEGELPWHLVGVGVAIALAVLILDWFLEKRRAKFRAHLMPVAVGIYLPLGLTVPILVGGIIAHLIAGKSSEAVADKKLQRGVLFASGAIAGESLMGVGIALFASFGIQRLELGLSESIVFVATLVAMVLGTGIFWKVAKGGKR